MSTCYHVITSLWILNVIYSFPYDLTNHDRLMLLNAHNDKRVQVANGDYYNDEYNFQPGSSNMNSLFWDISLESVAMEYAKKCIKGHNTNRNTDIWTYENISTFAYKPTMWLGENWYSTSASIGSTTNPLQPLLNGINWFFNEINEYNYSNKYQKPAAHYTQMIWANTRYVGCGFSSCSFGTLFICNYWPGGNVLGQYPYISGPTCTECDKDRTECTDNKLCGGCMSSSFTKSRGIDITADRCDFIGNIPRICGEAQSDGTSTDISVKVCINLDIQTVDITLIGPNNVWFSVGFDGTKMNNTYSIVVHGDNLNQQSERILGHWSAGINAPFDGSNGILFIDQIVENGIKTVQMTRDRVSGQNGVYSFPAVPTTINVIFGKGINTTFPSSMGGHNAQDISLVLDYVDTIIQTKQPTTDPTSFPTINPSEIPTTRPTIEPSGLEGVCCDCINESPEKGCIDLDCEIFICNRDPHCCEMSWDEFCAGTALMKCLSVPTIEPTSEPTRDTYNPSEPPPSVEPTWEPTKSPIVDAGCRLSNIDLVFLVDNSCGLSEMECKMQQDGIGEWLAHMKFDGE
eukprot:53955_1